MIRRLQDWWKINQNEISDGYMICPNCGQLSPIGRCNSCDFDAADPTAVAQLRVERARLRARQRAWLQRYLGWANALLRIDWAEHLTFLQTLLRWVFIGCLVGVLAGTASAVFLISLQWVTEVRLEFPQLLILLPVGGLLIGWFYYRFAGEAARGNNLVIEEVNLNRGRIPLRMAPMILIGTVFTHLFGGSAGREGTAIQMGTSLADSLARVLGLKGADRRMILMAGISGGFASVFGTPLAGFVFGMEVQSMGRIRYEGVIPCLTSALIGDLVTRAWGATHSHYPVIANVAIDLPLIIKIGIAGIGFGIISLLFIELTDGIRHVMRQRIRWQPLRPVVGGLFIILLTFVVGTQDYLGLSLPLIQESVNGSGVATFAFLLKLIFTAVTLGTGFLGGEVTPLFVIGSTLGFTLGRVLGVDPTLMATIGFVAVFAGASNTPLACTLMGLELFGSGAALYVAVGCFTAYLTSGHRGIYVTQIVGATKIMGFHVEADESLDSIAKRRVGWLPLMNGQLADMTVQSMMSPRPISVHSNMSILEMILTAKRAGVRTLPVVNESQNVVGIVTDCDLKRIGIEGTLGQLRLMSVDELSNLLDDVRDLQVNDIMTPNVVSIEQDVKVTEAVELMLKKNFKRVPVVDNKKRLTGLITRSDILRESVFMHPSEAAQLLTIGQVELAEVITIGHNLPLPQAVKQMQGGDYKRVVVVDNVGKVIGIFTDSDLLAQSRQKTPSDWSKLTVNDVMTQPVYTVTRATTVTDALRMLIEHQIKRLPVVSEDGHVLGLAGRAELMRVLLQTHIETNNRV